MEYFIGLDLNQRHEVTALAIVERTWRSPAPVTREPLRHYAVGHLERLPVDYLWIEDSRRVAKRRKLTRLPVRPTGGPNRRLLRLSRNRARHRSPLCNRER